MSAVTWVTEQPRGMQPRRPLRAADAVEGHQAAVLASAVQRWTAADTQPADPLAGARPRGWEYEAEPVFAALLAEQSRPYWEIGERFPHLTIEGELVDDGLPATQAIDVTVLLADDDAPPTVQLRAVKAVAS